MENLQATTYGPYRVVRKLGSGGMGTVYEAKHEVLGRYVAIKTIAGHVSLTAESRARFLREARAAARVRHRNVAQVHDVSVQDDVPYMVIELLHGQTLAALLEREVLLSPERAADLLVPVIAGVAAAHACAIVHRDLKPQNLFISEEQTSLVPHVLDFGVSKFADDEPSIQTGSDVILGTAHYMSPEQARGSRSLDSRSDQYSLAAVLYECVTGHKPFNDDTLYVLFNRIVASDFKRPSEVYSGVPLRLEAVILKAMSLEPNDRYATTALFGQALLPFCSYKTRLNYAQELAQFSNSPQTSPCDAQDVAAVLPPQAPDVNNTPEAHENANPRHTSGPFALSSTVEKRTPLLRHSPSVGLRQVVAAITLLCLGAGVGYSFTRVSGVGNAASPNERTIDPVNDSSSNPLAHPAAVASTLAQSTATADTRAALGDSSTTLTEVNSFQPTSSPVATSPSIVQKSRVSAIPTATSVNTTTEQNRAQQHGLVQETPF